MFSLCVLCLLCLLCPFVSRCRSVLSRTLSFSFSPEAEIIKTNVVERCGVVRSTEYGVLSMNDYHGRVLRWKRITRRTERHVGVERGFGKEKRQGRDGKARGCVDVWMCGWWWSGLDLGRGGGEGRGGGKGRGGGGETTRVRSTQYSPLRPLRRGERRQRQQWAGSDDRHAHSLRRYLLCTPYVRRRYCVRVRM